MNTKDITNMRSVNEYVELIAIDVMNNESTNIQY